MVRDKTKIRIQICQVLEIDGVDSMEAVVAEGADEFVSIRSFLRFFMILWQKAIEKDFRFL